MDCNPSKDPATAFDEIWATTVIDLSIDKMKQKLEQQDKMVYFKVFESYYDDKSADKPRRRDVAEKLGISESNVKYYLSYTKELLGKIIREEILKCVADPSAIDDELKYLLSLVKGK